ncbi:MAG: oligopeptide/dipeptide ABC transporter ATP-binding protein [Planctomycetota bacterium]
MREEPLVVVQNLTKHFPVRRGLLARVTGLVHAVDAASFEVPRGKTVALVGESGCGKTTTGRTLLRLLPPTSGKVFFDGKDVFALPKDELRPLRKRMQVIFQDPYASLNPRMTVESIVEEGILLHTPLAAAERRERVSELLEEVDLSPAYRHRYPHEFSGGQRQRIGIARALSTGPDFIVCDEAVSALDVSIQAQVLNLLADLQARLGIAYLFIAHDLAVVRHLAHRVVVMYLGHVLEEAGQAELFVEPLHPYTRALLASIPQPRPGARRERRALSGEVPSPLHPPPGCRFHTRCPHVMPRCKEGDIPTYEPAPGRRVKCVLFEKS